METILVLNLEMREGNMKFDPETTTFKTYLFELSNFKNDDKEIVAIVVREGYHSLMSYNYKVAEKFEGKLISPFGAKK